MVNDDKNWRLRIKDETEAQRHFESEWGFLLPDYDSRSEATRGPIEMKKSAYYDYQTRQWTVLEKRVHRTFCAAVFGNRRGAGLKFCRWCDCRDAPDPHGIDPGEHCLCDEQPGVRQSEDVGVLRHQRTTASKRFRRTCQNRWNSGRCIRFDERDPTTAEEREYRCTI